MASQTLEQVPQVSHSPGRPIQPRWSVATRVAFRFAFAYLSMMCVNILSAMISITLYFMTQKLLPGFVDPLWRHLVPWFGRHVVHLHHDIKLASNGDTIFDWLMTLFMITVAAVAALVWSVLDRKRANYAKLHEWLRMVVRLSLAMALIVYGVDKALPLQFGTLTLSRLTTPIGDLSPEGMLWAFMAASTGYTILSGIGELAGAFLLTIPRLANLGALVTIAVMSNVFALNVFYNVQVKIYSLNYLLMAIFLIVPDVHRLANVLIFNRATQPAVYVPLFRNRAIDRSASIAQLLVGSLFFLVCFHAIYGNYTKRQQAMVVRPPLYGIWIVNDFSMTGDLPAFSGDKRWHRLIFERPGVVLIQSSGGEDAGLKLALDTKQKTMALSDPRDSYFKANFRFEEPKAADLVLDGDINGNKVHATLHRMDETKFSLTSTGLHWIQ